MRLAAISVLIGIGLGAGAMLAMRGAGFGALSAAGLALGGSAGAWLNLALLWSGLRRRLGSLFDSDVLRPFWRLCLATTASGAAGYAARIFLSGRLGVQSTLEAAGVLAGALLTAGVVYLSIIRTPPRPLPNE
jgi:peptidoglycan biosynthesis protein MviN/MurJ (putative lipid II flippase)